MHLWEVMCIIYVAIKRAASRRHVPGLQREGWDNMQLKLRKELMDLDKVSYASDHIDLPEGGIDCGEGCTPYGFPPEMLRAAENFDMNRLGPYPHSTAIFDGLLEYWKGQFYLEPENLLMTDGSIAAIYVVCNIFNRPGARVVGIAPQFTDFEMTVRMLGMDYRPVFLRKENNYTIDPDEIIEAIDEDTSLVYIDNPNNPTGQIIDSYAVEQILKRAAKCGAAVIVDEAYGDFMPNQNSAAKFLEKYDNMIMMRTLSKAFGLAGLRIGYIVAAKPVIAAMRKITNPYAVSEFARELGGEALRHSYHIWENITDFARMKREIKASIGKGHLHIAQTYDTVSIFLLWHDDEDIDLKQEFYDRGVLCVSGADFTGLGKNYARIRLPKLEDFPVLFEAFRAIDEGR